ncbi:MAG: hypothetical protein GY760_21655 [Deltaproteobacteria bacterium]|nr:hypothetical protein [Deltaproteobacteria bacterium]
MKKIKKLKQKDILSQIIEEIFEGEKMVIIEWVKGHEKLDWDKHNWISKLKLKGNDWADKEAKIATSKEPEVAPEHYDKYSLYSENTGKKVMWTELPDFCKIWHYKQREIRLENPTRSCFEHGSGAYMKRARRNRTLAFGTLKKVGSKQEAWYYYTLKYMMNNVHTRKWIVETGRKQDRNIRICNTIVQDHECPVCRLQGKKYIQTKEHLWSGECIGTKDLEVKWENIIRAKCELLHIDDMTISDIVEKIKIERDLVTKQEYSIENHGKAAALTGMWSNETIIEIRNKIMWDGWEAGKAMQTTMVLMQEMQKIAEEIAFRFQYNKDIFVQNIVDNEEKEYSEVKKVEDTNNSRILAVKFNKWKDGKVSGLDKDTWEYWAYIKDQAIIQKIPTKEIQIQIQKSLGKQKIKILSEIKKYREWKEVPVRLVEGVKKEKRREIKYKRKRDARSIEDIIIFLVNRYEQQPSILEIIADNKLHLRRAWTEDIEIIKEKKRTAIFLGEIEEIEIPNKKQKIIEKCYKATKEQTSFLGDIEEFEIPRKKQRRENTEEQSTEGGEHPPEGDRELSSLMPQGT